MFCLLKSFCNTKESKFLILTTELDQNQEQRGQWSVQPAVFGLKSLFSAGTLRAIILIAIKIGYARFMFHNTF